MAAVTRFRDWFVRWLHSWFGWWDSDDYHDPADTEDVWP